MASTEEGTDAGITSFWIKFFTDANVPPSDAVNYAMVFCDNRIQKDMLLDLTKEYLNDMGIMVMGDIISILKHAKTVHAQESAKERAIRAAPYTSPSQPASNARDSPTPRRSTPTSRIIDHYLKVQNDPDAVAMSDPAPPPLTSARAANKAAAAAAKQSESAASRSSVFSRLGAESESPQPKVTVTGLGKVKLRSAGSVDAQGSSVFKRLGTVKRAATSTSQDPEDSDYSDEDALEYAGVLKAGCKREPPVKKSLDQRLGDSPSLKISIEQRLGAIKESVSQTEGILSSAASVEKTTVRQRLGPQTTVRAASSTTPSSTSASSSKTIATSGLRPGGGVMARLGPQKPEVSSSGTVSKPPVNVTKVGKVTMVAAQDIAEEPHSVFNRLGKQS